MVPVLAHFGHVIEFVPFVVPAIVLPVGLAALAARERRRESREG